jgi:hypothetical protein
MGLPLADPGAHRQDRLAAFQGLVIRDADDWGRRLRR